VGADQVAAIRPALAELEDDARQQTAGADPRFFARCSVPPDGSPWVEAYFEGDEVIINCWYPFDREPLAHLQTLDLPRLPDGRVVDRQKPACTVAFGRSSTGIVARFIDGLFMHLFTCGDDYPLDVAICRFAKDGA
jgi:hypothetical protein